jgi:hypothetical protein
MKSYEQFSDASLPIDAVAVHIHKDGATFLGDVHRRLAIVDGSVSVEDIMGPMSVPAALIAADTILAGMGDHGFTRVGVVLSGSSKWDPVWGYLGELKTTS